MSQIPEDLRFTESHEWVRVEGNLATIGITHHAQEQLGDVVFVELPEVDDELSKGGELGSVESTKAVSDVFSPVSGRVVAINEALTDAPETINSDPYGEGWMVKLELSDAGEIDDLLSPAAYEKLVRESEHE